MRLRDSQNRILWPTPGTVLAATDRRYKVAEDGSYRREPGEGQALPKRPICEGGIDAYTGKKCYCQDCRDERRRELRRPTLLQLESGTRLLADRVLATQLGLPEAATT